MDVIPEDESFIEYPCVFPIKAMGANTSEFRQFVATVGKKHDQALLPEQIIETPSSKGTYISITLMVNAVNRPQIDAIYTELTASELVKWAI